MRILRNTKTKVEYVKEFASKNQLSYMEALETIKFMYHVEDMEQIKKSLSLLRWLKAR